MTALERYESLIDDVAAFQAACERPLPSVVRVNTIKTTPERAKAAIEDADIEYEETDWHPLLVRFPSEQPGANWPYVHGWLHGQEEVSALPATVLDPEAGERVWDACAAPGRKTTQLAAQMADSGLLVATDNNMGRVSALRSNAERLGVTNLALTVEDARNHSLKPFDGEPYDRVLVDAPCTCEGTIRKNPDVLDEWSLDRVEGTAGVQKGILRRAIQTTRPGGTVVYSTCTFAPEENEGVLDFILEEEDCRLVPFEIPLDSAPGITKWNSDHLDEPVTYDESVQHAKRLYPHLNDTGGFFCAKLEVTG